MSMSDQELAEAQLQALREQGKPPGPTAVKARAEFSHEALVSLIIDNPTWTHKQYAEHFGRTAAWFAATLATDAFQAALDPRRHEVTDPSITATLEERFRALTLRSITVLQNKLESATVKDETVTKALEIGVRALAIGSKDDDDKPRAGGVEALAERLVATLQSKKQSSALENAVVHGAGVSQITTEGEIIDVPVKEVFRDGS